MMSRNFKMNALSFGLVLLVSLTFCLNGSVHGKNRRTSKDLIGHLITTTGKPAEDNSKSWDKPAEKPKIEHDEKNKCFWFPTNLTGTQWNYPSFDGSRECVATIYRCKKCYPKDVRDPHCDCKLKPAKTLLTDLPRYCQFDPTWDKVVCQEENDSDESLCGGQGDGGDGGDGGDDGDCGDGGEGGQGTGSGGESSGGESSGEEEDEEKPKKKKKKKITKKPKKSKKKPEPESDIDEEA